MTKVRTARLMIKLLVAFVAGGAVLLGSALDSQAAFKLRLSESDGTVVTITDNCDDTIDLDCDVSDGTATTDWISYSGSVGSFDVVFTGGFTGDNVVDPILMDVSSFETIKSDSTTGGGTLTVELTATDFTDTGSLEKFFAEIGGVLIDGATISYVAYIDTDNLEFQTDETDSSVTKVTDISGFGTDADFAAVDSLFSITMVITITCDGPCTSSFNAIIEMPEPATLALFGMGLLMLGAVARRQRKFWPTRGA